MQTTRRTVLASFGTVALAGCMGDNTDELEAELNATESTLDARNETLASARADNEELREQVEDLDATITEREETIGALEDAIEDSEGTITDLEAERDTAKADLTADLYRYGYALITQANEQYNTGTDSWDTEDYYATTTACERAYGLYASASAAIEQCADLATEQSRSQATHDMIDETTDYADTMGDASRDLAYAAKAATRDEWGEADSYHAQAADATGDARLVTLPTPDQFAEEL